MSLKYITLFLNPLKQVNILSSAGFMLGKVLSNFFKLLSSDSCKIVLYFSLAFSISVFKEASVYVALSICSFNVIRSFSFFSFISRAFIDASLF